MPLRLLADRVAIRPDIREETESGIALVTEKSQKIARGTVVAIGPGKYDDKGKFTATVIKPGDYVTFPKEAIKDEDKYEVEGETLLFMIEESILAILKRAE